MTGTGLICCNHRMQRRPPLPAAGPTMDLQLLDQTLADRGEPRFRARQVWAWAARGAGGYEQMTDLPGALREALARELPFSTLNVRDRRTRATAPSRRCSTTADGRPLEAVLMRYRDRPGGGGGRRSICVSSQSGCPLTCTFCATGAMRFARNLTRLGDPRPGASLPPHRSDRPLRVHGHGRADAEPRQRARRVRAAAGHRHHAPAHHDLDGRLDTRHRTAGRVRDADAPGAVAARRRRSAALRADARQRALSAARRDRGLPRLLRAQAPARVRRVRDARRRQRPLRAGARARRRAQPAGARTRRRSSRST